MGLTVPYPGPGGGGGGRQRFLFHKRVLMTLVIYELINVKFNEKRLKKLNILRKVNENCNFCSHLLENQLRYITVFIFLTKTFAIFFYSSDAISFLRFLIQMVNSSNQQHGTQNETSFPWFSSSEECIAWLTVFMAQSVAIITLNILTIIVLIKNRGLRKRSMYLVINLAVADMFVGGYLEVMNFFYYGVRCNFWQSNLSYLGLWYSVISAVSNTFILSSITNLAAISLERLHGNVSSIQASRHQHSCPIYTNGYDSSKHPHQWYHW